METRIGQTVSVVDDSKKDEIRDSEQSFSLLLPVKPDTLSKQYTLTSETVIKDKDQRSKSFVSDRREKRSCWETDIMPVSYNYIVDIKLEEEVLIKGVSKKEAQSMRKREHDVALQNTLQPERRKRRHASSSLEVGSQKDIVTEKKCTSSLLESEQKIQSFTKNTKKLKKNCQHSLIMRGLHKEMKTLTEKDGASIIIGLGSDKVSGNLQKSHSCSASESRPQQKMWNFRERIKPVWPEQNQDKSQRVKRSIPKLESTIQNLSLLKHRERKRVITSPKTQVEVKYPVRLRSAAVPHLSSKCTEGTENLMKNARVSLVKPQEQKRKKNSLMKLTVSKSQKGVKASNQNSKHLLESVVNFEENKKCRSTVIGINRMVTRAFSKSKMCASDGEKQSWKSEKSVTEILGCRQWILEKKMTREQMDCVPTEELLVTKTEGTSKEETDGKDEIVTSTVLKKETKTSREDTLDILSIRDSLIQDYGTLKSDANADGLLIKVDEIKSESLSGNSSIGIITESSLEDGQLTELDELTEVVDTNEKHEFSEKLLAMQEQKTSVQDFVKIENTLTIEPLSCDQLELPFPTVKAIVPQRQDTALKSWMNDFRFPRKCPPCPSSTTNSYETWKVEKNSATNLGLAFLPRGYCRYHFNSLNGCERPNCRYWHVLLSGNEKLCNEIIKKYINIGEVVLLQRAVHIFTDYYKEGTTGVHLDSQTFHDLLTSLLQSSLLKELFHVMHIGIMIKILPTVDILLKIFEEVASMKVREAVPELSDIFCKLIDAGMVLECEHIGYITKLLNQLHVSNQEITILMSRFQRRHFHKASFCDFDSAVAEFQHCKEKSDWAKLGTLYVNVKRACKNVDNLEKYSLYVASILISSVKEEKPGIPFCEFAAAVNADAHRDEGDMTSLGRIGISVMFSYYKIHQWSKAKKVLDVLHALKIHFTFFKGFLGQEQLASRCHIVNVAVEIFLKCGSLDGALWVLRESEWIISTASWPCDRMDVLNRHNLLYTIASELMTKNRYGETFEVLRNLPGFQNTCDTLDVSQYSLLFNKLLSACSESRNTGLSSAVVEFMLARNIPVEFNLLRALITALGRSCLWLKARTHYKSALALGCYPPPEGNLYRKLLLIPSYMTEVEMLLAIEIFLVSNASSIQSPGASSQILQIVLKRCEGNDVRNNEDYQNAVERLIQAARISNPKLFIKHLTVNVNMEQVYSLEHTCVLKWLKENMKWAGKVWLF
ncbi:protein TOPAZ1 isoform 4-T4 [Liasis olivaceus]